MPLFLYCVCLFECGRQAQAGRHVSPTWQEEGTDSACPNNRETGEGAPESDPGVLTD